MPKVEPSVVEQLLINFRAEVPSGTQLVKQALKDYLGSNSENAEWIKKHFSELVEKVQIKAYEKYLQHEALAGGRAFREVFLPMAGKGASAADLMEVIANSFYDIDRFFLSLTQGRRPRAGNAFEYVIKEMFVTLKYPFTPQAVINGQPDFLLPSANYYTRNAMDCIIFTVKRTLRERWRQIVTEGTRGLGFFLATIDEKVGVNDLNAMREARIYLVVPKRLKHDIPTYNIALNVLSFEEFFRLHLDPAVARWKAQHVPPFDTGY